MMFDAIDWLAIWYIEREMSSICLLWAYTDNNPIYDMI